MRSRTVGLNRTQHPQTKLSKLHLRVTPKPINKHSQLNWIHSPQTAKGQCANIVNSRDSLSVHTTNQTTNASIKFVFQNQWMMSSFLASETTINHPTQHKPYHHQPIWGEKQDQAQNKTRAIANEHRHYVKQKQRNSPFEQLLQK